MTLTTTFRKKMVTMKVRDERSNPCLIYEKREPESLNDLLSHTITSSLEFVGGGLFLLE